MNSSKSYDLYMAAWIQVSHMTLHAQWLWRFLHLLWGFALRAPYSYIYPYYALHFFLHFSYNFAWNYAYLGILSWTSPFWQVRWQMTLNIKSFKGTFCPFSMLKKKLRCLLQKGHLSNGRRQKKKRNGSFGWYIPHEAWRVLDRTQLFVKIYNKNF